MEVSSKVKNDKEKTSSKGIITINATGNVGKKPKIIRNLLDDEDSEE